MASSWTDHSEAGIAAQVCSCLSNLLALHAEYTAVVDRMKNPTAPVSSGIKAVFTESHNRIDLVARAAQDAQVFLDFINITDLLQSDLSRNVSEKEALWEENSLLKEEVEMLRRKLNSYEENIIQLESDKQQLELVNAINSREKEIEKERLSEIRDRNLDLDIRSIQNPGSLNSPSWKHRGSPAGSLNGRSADQGFRHRAMGLYRESEERSPMGKLGCGKSAGNMTLYLGDENIDVDELNELTDKLSWYESIIQQLQQIFHTELDDPDVTYHEESTKIVERAKRMVEYQSMVRDYEKTIGELRKQQDRLRSERNEYRSRCAAYVQSESGILTDATARNHTHLLLTTANSVVRQKSSR